MVLVVMFDYIIVTAYEFLKQFGYYVLLIDATKYSIFRYSTLGKKIKN